MAFIGPLEGPYEAFLRFLYGPRYPTLSLRVGLRVPIPGKTLKEGQEDQGDPLEKAIRFIFSIMKNGEPGRTNLDLGLLIYMYC